MVQGTLGDPWPFWLKVLCSRNLRHNAPFFEPEPFVTVPGPTLVENRLTSDQKIKSIFQFPCQRPTVECSSLVVPASVRRRGTPLTTRLLPPERRPEGSLQARKMKQIVQDDGLAVSSPGCSIDSPKIILALCLCKGIRRIFAGSATTAP